jgi:hypothetical protein
LALRFVAQALTRGERTCLVLSDSVEQGLEFCERSLGVDLKPHLESGLLVLLSFSPAIESKVRTLGGIDRPGAELAALFSARQIKNLVVDSLDPVLAASSVSNIKSFVGNIVGVLLRLEVTCMCTTVSTGGGALQLAAEELAARLPGVFDLSRDKLTIHASSWSALEGSSIPLRFVLGRGLIAAGEPVARRHSQAEMRAASGTIDGAAAGVEPARTLPMDPTRSRSSMLDEREPRSPQSASKSPPSGGAKPLTELLDKAAKLLDDER